MSVCFKPLITLLILLFLSAPAFSVKAQHIIQILDQHQQPVENAVVSFPAVTAEEDIPEEPGVMDQINQLFEPKILIIQKGQKVVFPNKDNTRHHVYSFSPAKPFEIKLYNGVPSDPVLFDKSGLVTLGCNIHDSMVGYIYVKDQELAALTGADGRAKFDKPPPELVEVWHSTMVGGQGIKLQLPLEATNDGILELTIKLKPPRPIVDNTFKARFK